LFNATAVALMYSRSLSAVHLLSLLCGFINGDATSTLYRRQSTELYIQSGKLVRECLQKHYNDFVNVCTTYSLNAWQQT